MQTRPDGILQRNKGFCLGSLAFAVGVLLVGLLTDRDPAAILPGLWKIWSDPGVLISDSISVGGFAAAMTNVALVILLTVAVLHFSGGENNGMWLATLGLTSGFAFFGKDPLNMTVILLGTWLYARLRHEPFAKHAATGLMASSLGPMVSFCAFAPEQGRWYFGLLMGLLIGFCLPPLAAHAFQAHGGLDLYNMGFSCGVFAMIASPVLMAAGMMPQVSPTTGWTDNLALAWFIPILSLVCIFAGLLVGGSGCRRRYLALLRTSGRAPVNYLADFGGGTALVSAGCNGLVCFAYVLLMGWEFSGPVTGAILSVMGFAAAGKHILNITPIMAGVALGSALFGTSHKEAIQIAGLFGTCLAPISGVFGAPVGILAGVIHSAVVLRTGGPAAGLNLYNNGFCAGMQAILFCAALPLFKKTAEK